ncbi:MAG: diguanylate cyclase domain-containing protein [Geminicoccales bacterium]
MAWHKLRLYDVIEHMPIGMAVTRPDGRIEYANPHLHMLLGVAAGGLAARELAEFKANDHATENGADRSLRANDPERRQGEALLRTQAGAIVHVLEVLLPTRDEGGEIEWLVHLVVDLSDRKRIEALSALAYHDALTGLPNRSLFRDRLQRAILSAERVRAGFALLYIDVDEFKSVNDSQGHHAGDQVLCEIAARIASALRKSDTLARLGGDEFAVILEGINSRTDASRVADKVMASCGAPYGACGAPVALSVSVGLSLYPYDGAEPVALLNEADRAMYEAKLRARDRRGRIAPPVHAPRD